MILSIVIMEQSPPRWLAQYTWLWAQSEQRLRLIGDMVNTLLLIGAAIYTGAEVIRKLWMGESVTDPHMALVVGVIGLLVNLINIVIFHACARHEVSAAAYQERSRILPDRYRFADRSLREPATILARWPALTLVECEDAWLGLGAIARSASGKVLAIRGHRTPHIASRTRRTQSRALTTHKPPQVRDA
jgi:Co/Zn/Cd efflux system component